MVCPISRPSDIENPAKSLAEPLAGFFDYITRITALFASFLVFF